MLLTIVFCPQVLLPAETEGRTLIPDWVFKRTPAEVKEQLLAARKKREQSEVCTCIQLPNAKTDLVLQSPNYSVLISNFCPSDCGPADGRLPVCAGVDDARDAGEAERQRATPLHAGNSAHQAPRGLAAAGPVQCWGASRQYPQLDDRLPR